jgi:hypothetical protein
MNSAYRRKALNRLGKMPRTAAAALVPAAPDNLGPRLPIELSHPASHERTRLSAALSAADV